MNAQGIGTASYRLVSDPAGLETALLEIGAPAVLKTTRMGYDGKGQVMIRPGDDPAGAWTAMAGEMYDGRGELWRLQYNYVANLYDRKSGFGSAYGAYDLLQNIYNLNGKPIPGKFRNGHDKGEKYFTPKGMARGGIR